MDVKKLAQVEQAICMQEILYNSPNSSAMSDDEMRELIKAAAPTLLERILELRASLTALTAYAAKLEKAGDGLADYHRPLNTVPRWQDSLNDWDAARKEKP